MAKRAPGLDLSLTPEAATLEAWEALARKALGGRSLRDLATVTADGIDIRPLGTRRDWPLADALGTPGLPRHARGAREPSDARWDIRQIQTNPDPAGANAVLLSDLANGCTSAWLKLDRGARGGGLSTAQVDDGIPIRSAADLDRVLADVPAETAIAFDAGAAALSIGELMLERAPASSRPLFLNHDVFAMAAACGAVPGSFDQELREAAQMAQRLDTAHGRLAGIDTRPYHNAGATPAQELGVAAASGVAYLRAFTQAGLDIDASARQVAFILVTDTDFLSSIAKLRAMRRIWGRVLDASGAPDAIKGFHLTAVTSDLMMTRRSAHTNILRTSVAAFAAALGGADAISVTPFNARQGFATAQSRRIARNIQAILMEEAQLARVTDPLGGSFTGERLTEDLAAAAWSVFQDIESRGGMAAALTSGFIRERMAAAWQMRRERIAQRRELITSVSDFPLLADDFLPAAKPSRAPRKQSKSEVASRAALARVMEPLPIHYLDEDFEALRAASDDHLAAAGARPKIALICLGAETDFAAREGLARTLFESGGVEAVRIQSGDAIAAAAAFLDSGIRIAALVSSDALYAGKALAFAHEMKRAGARYLYFIGAPGELEVPLLDAGVDEFVGEEPDAIELLRRAHRILGLRA